MVHVRLHTYVLADGGEKVSEKFCVSFYRRDGTCFLTLASFATAMHGTKFLRMKRPLLHHRQRARRDAKIF
jgi:hypothetical protein